MRKFNLNNNVHDHWVETHKGVKEKEEGADFLIISKHFNNL